MIVKKFFDLALPRNNCKVSGHFTLLRKKANTQDVVQILEFDNLITDTGLNALGTGGVVSACFVGSGTAPPAVTDTVLAATVAGTITKVGSISRALGPAPDYWTSESTTFEFAVGTAAGTLTEVGIGWGTYPGSYGLFSHALIVDSGGSPVALTVLSDEILHVTYTLKVYFETADVVDTLTLSGTDYTVTMRPIRVNNRSCNTSSSAVINLAAAATGIGPSNPPTFADATATWMTNLGAVSTLATDWGPYVNGSLKRTTLVSANTSTGNLTYGIRGIVYETASPAFNACAVQATVVPPIMKDNTMIMSYQVENSWGRH